VAPPGNQVARNRILVIGGPEALMPLEIVSIFEELAGRKFEVQKVPEEALRQQRASASNPLDEAFANLMLMNAGGWAVDMSESLKSFPIELTSIRDYARSVGGGVI
jgi:uncharacterized protein YbjT (DUF2867 family)